jgi:hypothetical protein
VSKIPFKKGCFLIQHSAHDNNLAIFHIEKRAPPAVQWPPSSGDIKQASIIKIDLVNGRGTADLMAHLQQRLAVG